MLIRLDLTRHEFELLCDALSHYQNYLSDDADLAPISDEVEKLLNKVERST